MAPTPTTDPAAEPAAPAPALTVGQLVGLPDESGSEGLKVGILTSVDPVRIVRLGIAGDYGLTVVPLA